MGLRFLAFAAAAMLAIGSPAFARDQGTSKSSLRNPVAEWCCGARASVALRSETSALTVDGHTMRDLADTQTSSEAHVGLDGANWNCQRPDGSQRCFTARPVSP
jgi:hypothetical protein